MVSRSAGSELSNSGRLSTNITIPMARLHFGTHDAPSVDEEVTDHNLHQKEGTLSSVDGDELKQQSDGHISKPVKRLRWATQRVKGESGVKKRMSIVKRFHKRSDQRSGATDASRRGEGTSRGERSESSGVQERSASSLRRQEPHVRSGPRITVVATAATVRAVARVPPSGRGSLVYIVGAEATGAAGGALL